MNGKVCLVTGATNGIGNATAQALAHRGATVVIVGRNAPKTAQLVEEIRAASGNKNVDSLLADLSSQQEVLRLAKDFKSKYSHLHILLNYQWDSKPLLSLAKTNGIELLVHNDSTNVLPRGTLRELLGRGEDGAGVLADGDKTGEKRKVREGEHTRGGLNGDVEPQWVAKYTAVVQNRGVVESKGYFAVARVQG